MIIPIVLVCAFVVFQLQPKPSEINNTTNSDTTSISPAPTDFTASFEITTNGTKRTFTQSMYHNQSEDVFIENSQPNTVYVKKSGTTWNDFFKTLPFSLTNDCLTTGTGQTFCTNATQTLRFFINGTENPNALDEIIKPDDKLEIVYEN